MGLATLLHVLGVVVWVGGMFFAYMALRPVAVDVLQPPLRLPLWAGVFRRFFPWVWLSILLILTSGFALIGMLGGMGAVGWHVHAMLAIGVVMMLIFVYIYFGPFARLKSFVQADDWKSAGQALGTIRHLIAINLSLGLLNIVLAKAALILK
ncbi:MAG: CopD family protein [Burkholderiales bacterium]